MTKAVAKKEQTEIAAQSTDPMISMIERMVTNPDVDVDKLERILAMKGREEAKTAEQEYTRAMVRVQQKLRGVTKNSVNPQTRSAYANLEAMKKAVVPAYTSEGFALSYGEGDCPKENHIRVTAKVMHAAGHSETFFYDCPIDDKGIAGKTNKTPTHGKASAVSYGERYILKLIFNVTIQNEDDDGNAAGEDIELISDQQLADLEALIDEVKADKANFCKACKVDDLQNLPLSKLKGAVAKLEAKRKEAK